MTEVALLNAIHQNPDDVTAKLVYADWLAENAENDRDYATEEFIRLCCTALPSSKSTRMPQSAYSWIRVNWRRLLPRLVEKYKVECVKWNGRALVASIHIPAPNGTVYTCRATFIFWNGFLTTLQGWSRFMFDSVRAPVKKDQPLCHLLCYSDASMIAPFADS